MLLLYWAISSFEFWPVYFSVLLFLNSLFCFFFFLIRKKYDLEAEFFFTKRIPAKIVIPMKSSLIMPVMNFFIMMLVIFGFLSLGFTWKIWVLSLIVCLILLLFFEHPHVWFKDSFDIKEKLKQQNQEKMLDGVFSYPSTFYGAIYHHSQDGDQEIVWSEILKIDVILEDYLTWQEISMFILLEDKMIKITESESGYRKFIDQLSQNIPMEKYWFYILMNPQLGEIVSIYQKNGE